MDCIVHEVAKSQTQLSDFHTVKGFSIVNEAEVGFLKKFSFSMIQWMLAI